MSPLIVACLLVLFPPHLPCLLVVCLLLACFGGQARGWGIMGCRPFRCSPLQADPLSPAVAALIAPRRAAGGLTGPAGAGLGASGMSIDPVRVVGVVGWSALGWRCRGRCWVYDMICRRLRYQAAAHVVRRGGHPLSPPVVAGSIALGYQGAGGIPLLASARCPCAACAAGVSRPATQWSVGDTLCAGRCGGRSGRVPFVPGCLSARGTLPATRWCAGWRLEVHHMGDVPLPLLPRVHS